MKSDQSAGELDDDASVLAELPAALSYGKPIRVGTLAPPSLSVRSEASALRLAARAADTGNDRLTSASERMSILFERALAVCRIMMLCDSFEEGGGGVRSLCVGVWHSSLFVFEFRRSSVGMKMAGKKISCVTSAVGHQHQEPRETPPLRTALKS